MYIQVRKIDGEINTFDKISELNKYFELIHLEHCVKISFNNMYNLHIILRVRVEDSIYTLEGHNGFSTDPEFTISFNEFYDFISVTQLPLNGEQYFKQIKKEFC